jgi:hypothetical protein
MYESMIKCQKTAGSAVSVMIRMGFRVFGKRAFVAPRLNHDEFGNPFQDMGNAPSHMSATMDPASGPGSSKDLEFIFHEVLAHA